MHGLISHEIKLITDSPFHLYLTLTLTTALIISIVTFNPSPLSTNTSHKVERRDIIKKYISDS